MHIPCADFDYYPLAALGYSLCVPTWPSICALQNVSVPCSAAFFPCPDKSFPLLSPVSEHLSLSVSFFLCPDKSLPLLSSGCGCTSVSQLLSVS